MVIIEMDNGGIIKLALDASAAPNTVKNLPFPCGQGILRWAYVPPHHPRLHDSGRLPRWNRHGWPGVQH